MQGREWRHKRVEVPQNGSAVEIPAGGWQTLCRWKISVFGFSLEGQVPDLQGWLFPGRPGLQGSLGHHSHQRRRFADSGALTRLRLRPRDFLHLWDGRPRSNSLRPSPEGWRGTCGGRKAAMKSQWHP